MVDEARAAAHFRRSIKPDGSRMIVEPMAGARLKDNLNPVGRLYYGASTMAWVPTSLAQEVGAALGASRRGKIARGYHCRRVPKCQTGRRNAFQHDPRSPAIAFIASPSPGRTTPAR